MEKVYISGQITGLEYEEYWANFKRAEELVLDHNLIPVNPMKVVACQAEDCGDGSRLDDGRYNHDWKCWVKHDIIEMLGCDTILMLPNWRLSRGAQFELQVADTCGLAVGQIADDYSDWNMWDGATR